MDGPGLPSQTRPDGRPHRIVQRPARGPPERPRARGAAARGRGAGRGDRGLQVAPAARRRRPQAESPPPAPLQGRLRMTIKWVQQDPLVMNGEPFCYGSRLTVRQLLEERANGYDLTRILKDHPELRVLGIAAAYAYAAEHRDGYADFFQKDGSLA